MLVFKRNIELSGLRGRGEWAITVSWVQSFGVEV